MVILEGLITNIIGKIGEMAAGKAWASMPRNHKVMKLFKAVGLKPGKPERDFDSVYAHALVEYGVEQPKSILDFFKHEDIREAFRNSFDNNDLAILHNEAATLIKWNMIVDDLRDQDINPRLEFARFTLVFNEMVDRTRTPAEVRREYKLDEILQVIKKSDLNMIRAKQIEMIQGGRPEQLKNWFRTLGYGFGGHDICTDEYCEWIIRIPARRGFDSILVRFIENQAEPEDIKRVEAAVKQHQTEEGWLIAAHRTSRSAKELAENNDKVFCYTFDELLDEQADFSRYFNWLESFVKERRIDADYVPLACKREIIDQTTGERTGEERYGKEEGWIEGYIDRWLEDPCKEHISILGEFGTGKTWFTHHYAWQVMEKYIEAKEKGLKRPRLPLVIQLRDYSKALNSESLFSDFFFRKHEIPLPGYSAFEQLNRMGRLLLIFDGFDEMADKLDRQKMINNFWELARVVVPGAKAVLTCRTEHFPNAKEGRDLLNAKLKASTRYLSGDPPQFEILELEQFNEDQIRDALLKRTDQKTVDLIMSHQELLDLAGRPVMLDFLVEALPDIEAEKLVDLSRIYFYATKAKLERDIKEERTFTSMADKLYFLCELSWEMLTSVIMSLNYRLFPVRLRNLFGPVVSDEKDLDHYHYDMMGNTLLTRNDDGDYSPAHRSLLEFFVAFKAVAELGALPPDFTAAAGSQSNIDELRDPLDYTWDSYFRREKDENGNIKQISPLKGFRAGDRDKVLESLGRMGDAVLRFVHEITNVEEVRPAFHEMLAGVMDGFKDGRRDPKKQQNIISFILKFRRLSQEWEEQANQGDSIRRFWADHLERELSDARGTTLVETLSLERSAGAPIKFEMVQVPAGSFLMGDESEGSIRKAAISEPFMIATVPVTNALYSAVTGDTPSRFEGDERPVESVSWLDAVRFCNSLSERLGLESAYVIDGDRVEWQRASTGFRLPTDAEWEYACRAGATTRFACGDLKSDLETMGWYEQNSKGGTKPVGLKRPNAWGLFDMHGNVWEWTWDLHIEGGSRRVVRGGCWFSDAHYCRSAIRLGNPPGDRGNNLGFRLSRSVSLGP